MPHVIVKLYPGRSEDKKRALAEAIARNVIDVLACDRDVLSVAFEEIAPEDWEEKVIRPDILDREATLYIRPGGAQASPAGKQTPGTEKEGGP